MNGPCGQFGALALLFVALLFVIAAIRRSAPRACPRFGAMDRRPCRYCARCGLPRCGSPRGGGAESVAEAIAPASSKVAFEPKSPASRLRVGWCQGALARDCAGHAVFPRQSVAASWSLLGAIAASLDCGTPEWTAYFKRLSRVLGAPSGSARWLAEWNDDPTRTQAEVVAAAAAAEEAGR